MPDVTTARWRVPLGSGARLTDAATERTLAGPGLIDAVASAAGRYERAPEGVVLCLAHRDIDAVVAYLGARWAGRPVILWDPASTAGTIAGLVARLLPAAIVGLGADTTGLPLPVRYVGADSGPGRVWIRDGGDVVSPDERLDVLLGTSGSTGEPRLVRQSAVGVSSSAAAIVAALGITPDDVAITSLPLHHTYGLSVLHSHLLAGATVVLDRRGSADRGFWAALDRHRVTSIAGVPHTFEVLARVPWSPQRNPSVRALTLSGGRLRDDLVTHFHTMMDRAGGRFYVMYGQTEAGSRICVLPPEHQLAKLGSVGPPVPGTRLTLADPTEDGSGEVVCHSASVMMGYAETATDLNRGDDLQGLLHTGDVGRIDDDGYLWLQGRISRTGKVFGARVNLDAVEHVISGITAAAAVSVGDRVQIFCEGLSSDRHREVVREVANALGVNRHGLLVASVDELPRLSNGKVNYPLLQA